MRIALLIALMAWPAAAKDRAVFHGTWGTAKQCARTPIKPGGTVLAAPFQINKDWLRHGQVWCRLTWFPVARRQDGYFTGAHAQCGEDAVQDYTLRMKLKDEALTVSWGIFQANGPLKRCQE